jgi:hypothetical protein
MYVRLTNQERWDPQQMIMIIFLRVSGVAEGLNGKSCVDWRLGGGKIQLVVEIYEK